LQWGQALLIPAGNIVPTQRTYIVKSSDTLTAIALRNKTNVRALMLANNLWSSVSVSGQVLRIP
jgi:LysM repeat protein